VADVGQPDERMDRFLGALLRVGVAVSAAVVVAGAILYLARHGTDLRDFRTFRGEPPQLEHPAGVVRSALHGDDRGVIMLGLLALIATPIARVAASIGAFARQRDWLYVGLTTFVLAVLIYSVIGGS
jgi:uncharacterized membrane protein